MRRKLDHVESCGNFQFQGKCEPHDFSDPRKKYEIDWGPGWREIGGNCAENCGGKCGKCGNMPKNAGTADRMIAPIPNSPLRFPREKMREKQAGEIF